MSELKVNSVVGTVKALPDNLLPVTASAWARIDGFSPIPNFLASQGFSSITDNGVGNYTLNFTEAKNSTYSVVVSRAGLAAVTSRTINYEFTTLSGFVIRIQDGTVPVDSGDFTCHVFGGQS